MQQQRIAPANAAAMFTFRMEDVLGGANGPPPAADLDMINFNAEQAVPRRQQPNRHRRPPPSFEDVMMEAEQEAAEGDGVDKKKRKAYRLTGLPSYAEFDEMYGAPKPPSECFGCQFITRRTKMIVPVADMEVIIKLMRTCPAQMSIETLAVQVSEKQVEMARRMNSRMTLDDPSRIVEWDPATVCDHLRGGHLMAPALDTRVMHGDLKKVWNFILRKSLIQVDKQDGDESVNESQMRNLERTFRMLQSVSKNKLKDMTFYNPGAVLEEEAMGAYVAKDAMRLIRTLKKRKKGFS